MNYAEGTFERAGELLGKDVRVSLDDNVLVEGRLLTYDDGGGVTVVDEGGFVHHCWPLLKIEEKLPERAKLGKRLHYETEEDAKFALSDIKEAKGWTVHHYVDGILTLAVPDDNHTPPLVLLRENEGLYWQEPDNW